MKTTTVKLYYSDAGSGPVVSLNDVAKILGLRDGGVLSRLADPRYLCHVHKNGLFSTNDEPRKGLQVCAYDDGVWGISNRARAPKVQAALTGLANLMTLLTATDDGKKNTAYLVYEKNKKLWSVADTPTPAKTATVYATPEVAPEVGAAAPEAAADVAADIKARLDKAMTDADKAETVAILQDAAIARQETVQGVQEPVIPNKDVARAMGLAEETLRWHKSSHPELLKERVHWVVGTANTPGGFQNTICWTRAGITLLVSELVRTDQARAFLRRLLAAKMAQASLSPDDLVVRVAAALGPQIAAAISQATAPKALLEAQATAEKRAAEYEAGLSQARQAMAAQLEKLAPLQKQAAAVLPGFFANNGIATRRTWTGKNRGDRIPPPYCDWVRPSAVANNPAFGLPPVCSMLVKNRQTTSHFLYQWMMVNHGLLELLALTPDQTERIGGKTRAIWKPTAGLGTYERDWWARWDWVVDREESPFPGQDVEHRGPVMRWHEMTVRRLEALWRSDYDGGGLVKFAAYHRQSWFDSGAGRDYLKNEHGIVLPKDVVPESEEEDTED